MGARARRAIASVGILVFLIFYIWAVIAIGAHVPEHPVATLLFYGLAGTLWGVPLLPLMSWAEGKPFLKKKQG